MKINNKTPNPMKFTLFIAFTLLIEISFAQQSLPVIKAKSRKVDIKCNGKSVYSYNKKACWLISPEIKPDIYYSDNLGDTISFQTDQDTLNVILTDNTEFNFIVLFRNDSAYTQIKYFEPYLTTLKKAYLFNETQDRDIPGFTYLESKNRNLKKIRKSFNLDSIAGQGDEVSQMLNIMHWVHNKVKHDGSSDNPGQKNALDLVNICLSENRGVNCRMMATILNECYLAMGFKSRMITCKPKPLEFNDCHVINTAFSNQLNKWIWLDPTFDAYVMNEEGELLGIQEVRERLINDNPLILNPEANWNRKTSQKKEYYLYKYMAKNLYRLEANLNSTYNSETVEENKIIEYIQLLPLDGINQEPIVKIYTNPKNGVIYKTYIINNPKQFWGEK